MLSVGDVFGGLAFARPTLHGSVPTILEVGKNGVIKLVVRRAYVREGGEDETRGRWPMRDMVILREQKVLIFVRS